MKKTDKTIHRNFISTPAFCIITIFFLSLLSVLLTAIPASAISIDRAVSVRYIDPPAHQDILPVSLAPVQPSQPLGDDSGKIEGLLLNQSLPIIMIIFFGLGLLLSLTPCVFPMIPILSGIIVGQGKDVSRKTAFILSAGYLFGMAAAYSLAGVAAALSGTMISSGFQNVWVLGSFSLVFVLLAFSMFGYYDLQLPSKFQSSISKKISSGTGSLVGATLMGAVSALVVSPCVAAPLAGALLYIAKTGNVVTGGAALFCMAIGMGVPLLLVGVFAGAVLPKAGAWMELIKKGFGVVLLGVAIWLLHPVASDTAIMLAWSVLFTGTGIFFYRMISESVQQKVFRILWKGVSAIFSLYGFIIFSGLVAGSVNPLNPVDILKINSVIEKQLLQFEEIHNLPELELAVKKSQKPVMLFITADWCSWCKRMKQTFDNQAVRQQLSGFNTVIIDISESTKEDKRLMRRFGIYGPPGMVFLVPDQNSMQILRSIMGYQKPAQFVKILKSLTRQQSANSALYKGKQL